MTPCFEGTQYPPSFSTKSSAKALEGKKAQNTKSLTVSSEYDRSLNTVKRSFRCLTQPIASFGFQKAFARQTRWSGKPYTDLPDDVLRQQLDDLKLDVQMISEVSSPDEIRDLFIRLQSGTALTRQQVRDAWPGNIGPFIERIGGKMTKQPSSELFGLIDGRGNRSPDDDGDDPYSNDRATAAQLLTIFLARERSERNFVGHQRSGTSMCCTTNSLRSTLKGTSCETVCQCARSDCYLAQVRDNRSGGGIVSQRGEAKCKYATS